MADSTTNIDFVLSETFNIFIIGTITAGDMLPNTVPANKEGSRAYPSVYLIIKKVTIVVEKNVTREMLMHLVNVD